MYATAVAAQTVTLTGGVTTQWRMTPVPVRRTVKEVNEAHLVISPVFTSFK